jgi:hypothetical protein
MKRHTVRCPNHEHHRDWLERCECGWWSCIGRGCGSCPDCCGEACECRWLGVGEGDEPDPDAQHPVCDECQGIEPTPEEPVPPYDWSWDRSPSSDTDIPF